MQLFLFNNLFNPMLTFSDKQDHGAHVMFNIYIYSGDKQQKEIHKLPPT